MRGRERGREREAAGRSAAEYDDSVVTGTPTLSVKKASDMRCIITLDQEQVSMWTSCETKHGQSVPIRRDIFSVRDIELNRLNRNPI